MNVKSTQNRCSEIIRKLPEKAPYFVANFSTHFIGQDNCLRKINLKIFWNHAIRGTFK